MSLAPGTRLGPYGIVSPLAQDGRWLLTELTTATGARDILAYDVVQESSRPWLS
jgi:hypothetical protein